MEENKKSKMIDIKINVKDIDAEKVSRRTFVGILATGVIGGAYTGGRMGNAKARAHDHEAVVQQTYDTKIADAQKEWEYQAAMQDSLGQLPENFNKEEAKEKFTQAISTEKMEQAQTYDYSQNKNSDFVWGGILGGIVGTGAGLVAGMLVAPEVEKLIKEKQAENLRPQSDKEEYTNMQ